MKTKAILAVSASASVCAILLLADPLTAAEKRSDHPGAFDVAQRAPDERKGDHKSDDDKKKKHKQRDERSQNKGNGDKDARGTWQKDAKPGRTPQKEDARKAREERPRRDASPKPPPSRAGTAKDDTRPAAPPRAERRPEPKAAPAPAPQPKSTQKRDDDRRRDARDTRGGDRKDADRGDRERRYKTKPGEQPKGHAQQPPKAAPRPAAAPSAKPDGDRDRRARDDHSRGDKSRENARTKDGRPDGNRHEAAQHKGDKGKRSWRHTGFGFKDIQKQRKQRAEDGGKRTIIEEPDKRVIVRDGKRTFIRHDETQRFRRGRGDFREERRKDGTRVTIVTRPGGVEIITVLDSDGHMLRRSRRSGGKEYVLIDNRPRHRHRRPGAGRWDMFVDLPPPVIRIPREEYLVEYDDASEEDIYEALSAGPIDQLERGYSLDEIRQSRHLRQRMRRIELNSINFEFGSWDVSDDQFPKLERVARAMNSILRRNADVVFMIEGHTDAVGSDIDNLSLSDRRAETVASILSEEFDVPPENLVTQGYGEEYLKIETDGPERANRRVTVLNISPLLGSDRYSEYEDRD